MITTTDVTDKKKEFRRRFAKYLYWALVAFCVTLVLIEALSTLKVTAERDAYMARLRFWSWIVEHSEAAIFVVDADSTNIEACNPGVNAMLGWTTPQVVGMSFLELMPTDEQGQHSLHLHSKAARDQLTKRSHRVRCWVKGTNGLVHVEANVVGVPAVLKPATSNYSTASRFKFLIILNDPDRVSTQPDQPKPTDVTPPNVNL
jgi:PAS domain S-box-containing protein